MKLINIYRDQHTVIPREVVFDKRLDYRSRGILTTLLALPDGWSFSVEGLAALVSSNNDGSKGLGSAALNYFRAKGAFVLETHSDENVKYYIKQGGKAVLQRKLTKNLKYSIIVSKKRINGKRK